MKSTIYLIIFFITLISEAQSLPLSIVRVNQGWSESDRHQVYQQDEGSQFIPLVWFLSLELPQSNLLMRDQLQKFGFLVGAEKNSDPKENPYNLPIGMSINEDSRTESLYGEKKWVGVNCAACHTSVMDINNKRLVIEGGANMFNFNGFLKTVSNSVSETLKNEDKWNRFQTRVQSADKNNLKARFEKFDSDLNKFLKRNSYQVSIGGVQKEIELGPERMDGIGLPNNEQLCHLDELGDLGLRAQFVNSKNCGGLHPPTGVPHLWGAYNENYTHYLGQIHSSMGRNVGQASGVLARNWLEKGKNGEPIFQSTTNFQGLLKLEKIYGNLRAPKWNDVVDEGIAPKLEEDLVKKGQAVYEQAKCIQCHALQPEQTKANLNGIGRSFWKINVTPYKEVGTDPGRLLAEVDEKVEVSPLFKNKFIERFGATEVTPKNHVSSQKYRTLIVVELITKFFEDNNYNSAQKLAAASCRLPDRTQDILGYKAQSLAGVVWTAPFLHNSSVPNLESLLMKPEMRPKKFYLGCRNYDLDKVGYACDEKSENSHLVDTSIPGFSNAGHDYGTDLSAEDKRALIEFIKSIEQAKIPSKGICQL